MLLPSYEKAVRAASNLTVFDQETATFVPFVLNEEQLEILRMALVSRRLIVGKGRQVGCSTVFMFLLTLIAIMNPGLPICVIGDEQDTAAGLLGVAKHWLTEMGVRLITDNVKTLVLENGARLVARTAISHAGGDEGQQKESKAGRSKTFAVIYATEMAFWQNAGAVWAALTGTATLSMLLFVDSTGAPGRTLFRDLLEKNGTWERLFIGFERHANYRDDPNTISDETFAQMKKEYGFTRKDSAAWWKRKLDTDIHDVFRMLREYPVLQVHMFLYQEGQHIRKWLEVPVRIDGWWNYYVDNFTEPIIIGVDTAIGAGKHGEPFGPGDASAIGILGHRTGHVLSTFRCNTIDIPAFIVLVKETVAKHAPAAFLVESNGVGAGVWQATRGLRGATEQWSSSDSKHSGELHVRRGRFRDAIEAKQVPLGGDLLTEARSSVVTMRGFEGHDDLISACSFAWMWREAHPFRVPAPVIDRMTTFVAPKLKRGRKVW